jgi:DNA-binding protein HU-beta
MNRKQMVKQIARRSRQTQITVDDVLQHFMDIVAEALVEDNRCTLVSFGTFVRPFRKARTIRIPNTDRMKDLPAHYGVRFKPSPYLIEAVNKDGVADA